MAMEWRYYQKDVLPFIAIVTVECTNVGLNVLFKAAASRGLSYYVFIVYSYAIGTILLLPLTFIFRRSELPPFKLALPFKLFILGLIGYGTDDLYILLSTFQQLDIYANSFLILLLPLPFILPSRTRLRPLNFSLILNAFLLGLIGFVASLCAYKGIEYSSPTLASVMSNLTPAFTFILAVIFRMERLSLRSTNTQAKLLGTLVSISGALVVVLYKGPTVLSTASEKDWVKGGLLLTVGYLLFSTWSILQTHIMKIYPAELVWALLYNLFGTIISAPVCLFIAETNSSAWILRPDVALISIIYSGLFGSAFSSIVSTWCLDLKGPVYVSIFKPLSIAIAAASSVMFLGDHLSLGSVVGAVMISIGFYGVIWGQAKEEEMRDEGHNFDCSSGLPSGKAPLLETYKVASM